jgi:hypothetical protein
VIIRAKNDERQGQARNFDHSVTPGNRTPESAGKMLLAPTPQLEAHLEAYLAANPGSQPPRSAYDWSPPSGVPSSKSDVFGLGTLLWSTMELCSGDDRLAWEQDAFWFYWKQEKKSPNQCRNTPAFSPLVKEHYSEELQKLVLWCTKFKQEECPSFRQVLKTVARCSFNDDTQRTLGLREAKADNPNFYAGWSFEPEKFKLGSILVDNWRSLGDEDAPEALGLVPGRPKKREREAVGDPDEGDNRLMLVALLVVSSFHYPHLLGPNTVRNRITILPG